MIDTIKIYSIITKEIYDVIKYRSDINTKYNKSTGELYYEITTDSLVGSYDSRLSVKVSDNAGKYKMSGYLLEVEGSYHKITKGQNAYNGCCDLVEVVFGLVNKVEQDYGVNLGMCIWYIQRVDIAICFDLDNNSNVCNYINNLSKLSYPRRKIRFYENESIYCSSTSTTLKIYNKLREFKKHDVPKLKETDFNILEHQIKIDGYIRYECEIKKRKLSKILGKDRITILDVNYDKLYDIWKSEFMKLIKYNENNINLVRSNNDVKKRLLNKYKSAKAMNLFGFYLSLVQDGYTSVRDCTSSTTFYRKLKELKDVGVDFNQNVFVKEDYSDKIINFNPFENIEREVV